MATRSSSAEDPGRLEALFANFGESLLEQRQAFEDRFDQERALSLQKEAAERDALVQKEVALENRLRSMETQYQVLASNLTDLCGRLPTASDGAPERDLSFTNGGTSVNTTPSRPTIPLPNDSPETEHATSEQAALYLYPNNIRSTLEVLANNNPETMNFRNGFYALNPLPGANWVEEMNNGWV
ncbi:hypothetical protein KPH14_002998 [Odynerus spinipes]|uniref:Uncharacterized protein n=1 Tax=Odynerus spinipes TaxID=1348599 RepID=A0AAD9RWK4_9HYME|nr:hypothetical protein KPH14_002998 [Odynerus spinipes]